MSERNVHKDSATHFTDALEYGNGVLKIPYVEDRNREFDVCIMPDTIDRREPTGLAVSVFLGRTLYNTVSTDLGVGA